MLSTCTIEVSDASTNQIGTNYVIRSAKNPKGGGQTESKGGGGGRHTSLK